MPSAWVGRFAAGAKLFELSTYLLTRKSGPFAFMWSFVRHRPT